LSRQTIRTYPTLDTVTFSFHNSSKTSPETRHAYIANFRVHSPSNLVIHGLCHLTVRRQMKFSIDFIDFS